MSNTSHLNWPFFNEEHRQLQTQLDHWASENIHQTHGKDVDQECRDLVKQLGEAGWLKYDHETTHLFATSNPYEQVVSEDEARELSKPQNVKIDF